MGKLRALDYYIKNLNAEAKNEIYIKLDDINPATVRNILEKDEGYPSFKRSGLDEKNINSILKKNSIKFENVNQEMIKNERYPIFTKSDDAYKSSKEYVEILKRREEKELIEMFGCTWKEYVPKIYKKENPSLGEK